MSGVKHCGSWHQNRYGQLQKLCKRRATNYILERHRSGKRCFFRWLRCMYKAPNSAQSSPVTFLSSAAAIYNDGRGSAKQQQVFLSGAGNLESFSYYYIPAACLCRYQFLCCAQALHGRNSFGLETIHDELHRCTCIGGCYSPPPSPEYAGHADDGTMVEQGAPTSCF